MAMISKKKEIYPISDRLRSYIKKYDREIELPIDYSDLTRYDNLIPQYDKNGQDTLWETVFYPQGDMDQIYRALKTIYAIVKAGGDLSVMDHLIIDRVDLCAYGNTKPFRIRVVNQINDNFDYFYIKNADASRIYGLELEHLLSPNKISYVVNRETLIEEHIVGVPADLFIKRYLDDPNLNEIRLSKEFVKFNERCFVRLLGDMHSSNFVVDITPDFEDVDYRLRAIDFDQQSYEGRRNIYLPQYYSQNNPIIEIGLKHMTPETVRQYQREERSNIANRLKVERERVDDLLDAMKHDTISNAKNIKKLGKELSKFYEEPEFLECHNMGEIVEMSLEMLIRKPNLYHGY
jgi:predicted transcriptional regulator